MRDLLREHGVDLRLGVADKADARREAEAADELVFDDASDDESASG